MGDPAQDSQGVEEGIGRTRVHDHARDSGCLNFRRDADSRSETARGHSVHCRLVSVLHLYTRRVCRAHPF
jgi:hypothetical protein